MLNNAGERGESGKFCIFNHRLWKHSEIRKPFLFFLPIIGGWATSPPPPLNPQLKADKLLGQNDIILEYFKNQV